jgi:hypothetical protein
MIRAHAAAPPSDRAVWWAIGLVAGTAALVSITTAVLPAGIDWHQAFYPAARALLRGESPYAAAGEFNLPAWSLVPLLPFASGSEAIGRGALCVLALGVLGGTAYRFGASPVALALFLLSPPVLTLLLYANLDWLVLGGLVVPLPLGALLLSIKPQIGAVVLLWCGIELVRRREWRGLALAFGPLAALSAAQLALFGLTPLRATRLIQSPINASLWPWSIPPGLVLFALSLVRREGRWAMIAAPLLTPYMLLHSYSIVLLAIVHRTKLLAVIVAGLWLVALWAAL